MENEDAPIPGIARVTRAATIVAAVAALALVPAAAGAQGLPSSDDLESGGTSESADETDQGDDESAPDGEDSPEGDESSEAAADETDSEDAADEQESTEERGDEMDRGMPPPKSEQASEKEASEKSEGEKSEGQKSGSEKAESEKGEGEKAGSEKSEKKKVEGKKGKKKKADKKKEKAKRGKVVATDRKITKEVEGRGAVEGDPRWVQSGVNGYGVPGFQHIASARPNRSNTYDVSFFGRITSGENMIRARDTNTFVGGRLNVHAQIIEYFSANVSLNATNNVNNFGRPQAMLSQGDTALGLRGHYPLKDFLDLAADVTLEFPTGFGAAGLDFRGTSVTPRVLASFDLDPLLDNATVPLAAHLNFGYRFDNTQNTVPDNVRLTRVERFAHDISAYDYVELGIGATYQLPYVSPFLSWNVQFPTNGPAGICGRVGLDCVQNFGFKAYPDILSLGLRGEPTDQLSIHAGVDLSLTTQQAAGIPATAPYTVMVGANWKIDPRPRVERITKKITKTRRFQPKRGYLIGTVVDQKSGKPVKGAQIVYVDKDRSPQVTGRANGQFRSYGFEPGTKLTVQVSHPKYHDKEVTGPLKKGEQERTFELKPKPQKGTVTGKVTDKEGNAIAGATVRFAGPQLKEVRTDSSGSFEAKLKAGKYGIGATSEDHFAENKTLQIPAGEKKSVDFSLEEGGQPDLVKVKEDTVEVNEKIHFEFGTAKLSENSHVILDQVASTLKSHPELTRIEVAGHTDNVGSDEENLELSRNRAKAVHDYLIKQGVNESRLVSKGYGESQPLVPNISDRNRQLNRRVEFKILERREPDKQKAGDEASTGMPPEDETTEGNGG